MTASPLIFLVHFTCPFPPPIYLFFPAAFSTFSPSFRLPSLFLKTTAKRRRACCIRGEVSRRGFSLMKSGRCLGLDQMNPSLLRRHQTDEWGRRAQAWWWFTRDYWKGLRQESKHNILCSQGGQIGGSAQHGLAHGAIQTTHLNMYTNVRGHTQFHIVYIFTMTH